MTIKATIVNAALLIITSQAFATPLSAQTENQLATSGESQNSPISIELETSRPKVAAGESLLLIAKITNTSKQSVFFRKDSIFLTLPQDLVPGLGNNAYAWFPTERNENFCLEVKPQSTYRAYWNLNSGRSDVTQISTSFDYLLFQPANYSAALNAKYWVSPKNGCKTIQANENYNLYSNKVIIPEDAPLGVIVFGAGVGGFLSWLLIFMLNSQKDGLKTVKSFNREIENIKNQGYNLPNNNPVDYDLILMPLSSGESFPPKQGNRLIAIAKNDQNALHFCIFDNQGNKAVDLQETSLLPNKNKQLESIKILLQPYWSSNASSIPSKDKKSIIDAAISITDHTHSIDHWYLILFKELKITNMVYGLGLTKIATGFASLLGAVLLSTVVTILLYRTSDSKFFINVTVNDVWGSVATGFVAHYFGGTWILKRFNPGSDQKDEDSENQNAAQAGSDQKSKVSVQKDEGFDKLTDSA